MSRKKLSPGEIRSLNDDIRDQHKKMKDMTFKEKISYFWCYYKYHTIGTIIAIIALSSLIINIFSSKDYSFYGILLNASDISEQGIEASFAEYAGLDTQKYDCFIDTGSTLSISESSEYDLATVQRILALIQTKDLDAIVIDSSIYNNYAYGEMFQDVRDVLSAEDIKKYEKNFYYVDYAEIRKTYDNPDYNIPALISPDKLSIYTIADINAEADSHRHPEDMKEPIPVGIFLNDSPFAVKSKSYTVFCPVFGFSVTSTRNDTSTSFLNYLWDESVEFDNMHRDLYE